MKKAVTEAHRANCRRWVNDTALREHIDAEMAACFAAITSAKFTDDALRAKFATKAQTLQNFLRDIEAAAKPVE